jgi:hypothetical protein
MLASPALNPEIAAVQCARRACANVRDDMTARMIIAYFTIKVY